MSGVSRIVKAAAVSLAAIIGVSEASSAHASLFLMVNVQTGNVRIYGEEGDVLTRYEIKTTASDWTSAATIAATSHYSFDYTKFAGVDSTISDGTRFGEWSVGLGYGLWHSHGLAAGVDDPTLGTKTTYRVGEMCAVLAGGSGVNTSVVLTFGPTSSASPVAGVTPAVLPHDDLGYYLDLGDIFIPGSPEDIIFTYTNQPGYSFNSIDGIGDGPKSYNVTAAGSPYIGSYTEVTPITSELYGIHTANIIGTQVIYTPEPASCALIGLVGLALIGRRKRA